MGGLLVVYVPEPELGFTRGYRPTMYLIDADGFVRYGHIGEGAYGRTETKIRELLSEKDRTGI